MANLTSPVNRSIAVCLAVLLAAPVGYAASASPQQLPSAPSPQTTPSAQTQNSEDANAPRLSAPGVGSSPQVQPQNQSAANPSSPSQPAPAQQQQNPSKPLGTAAAPNENAAGATASRPAGAVIAPAKQRRVRIIVIRAALIIGGAVALGTVLALTHETPSKY